MRSGQCWNSTRPTKRQTMPTDVGATHRFVLTLLGRTPIASARKLNRYPDRSSWHRRTIPPTTDLLKRTKRSRQKLARWTRPISIIVNVASHHEPQQRAHGLAILRSRQIFAPVPPRSVCVAALRSPAVLQITPPGMVDAFAGQFTSVVNKMADSIPSMSRRVLKRRTSLRALICDAAQRFMRRSNVPRRVDY
jgi:hypothetical protein